MAYKISTKEFSFHYGTFAAEASELGDMFARMLDGFVLVSEKTGKEVPMILKEIHREAAQYEMGDVAYWEFVPEGYSTFDNLFVFND